MMPETTPSGAGQRTGKEVVTWQPPFPAHKHACPSAPPPLLSPAEPKAGL